MSKYYFSIFCIIGGIITFLLRNWGAKNKAEAVCSLRKNADFEEEYKISKLYYYFASGMLILMGIVYFFS